MNVFCSWHNKIHFQQLVIQTRPRAHGQEMTTTLMAKQSENGNGVSYSSLYQVWGTVLE